MLKYIGYFTSFVLFEHKLNVDGGLGERRQKHTIIETKQGTWRKMQLWSSGIEPTPLRFWSSALATKLRRTLLLGEGVNSRMLYSLRSGSQRK